MIQKLTAKAAKALYREQEGLRLKRARMTYQQIADQLTDQGYPTSRKGAYEAVLRAYHKVAEEVAGEAKVALAAELDFVDGLIRAVMPPALAHDVAAVAEARKLSEHRSRLLGLYEIKVRQEISGPGGGPIEVGTSAREVLEHRMDELAARRKAKRQVS